MSEREGTSRTSGEVWRRRDALVFAPGLGVVASVGFRGESVKLCPPAGSNVHMLVEVGSYRDDDTLDFVKHITEPQPPK